MTRTCMVLLCLGWLFCQQLTGFSNPRLDRALGETDDDSEMMRRDSDLPEMNDGPRYSLAALGVVVESLALVYHGFLDHVEHTPSKVYSQGGGTSILTAYFANQA